MVEAALEWGQAHVDIFDYRYLWRLHKSNVARGGIERELWNPIVLLAWAMARPPHLSLTTVPERVAVEA